MQAGATGRPMDSTAIRTISRLWPVAGMICSPWYGRKMAMEENGAPGKIRTPDPQIRSPKGACPLSAPVSVEYSRSGGYVTRCPFGVAVVCPVGCQIGCQTGPSHFSQDFRHRAKLSPHNSMVSSHAATAPDPAAKCNHLTRTKWLNQLRKPAP